MLRIFLTSVHHFTELAHQQKSIGYTGSNTGEQALQQVFQTIHRLIYSRMHQCTIQIISVSEEEIENFSAQGLCDLRWAFATQQWLEPSLEDGNFHGWEWKPTWGDILQCLLGSSNFKQPLMSPKEAISVAPGWVERPEYVPKGRWTVKKKTHAKCPGPVYGSGSIFAGM